MSTDFTDLIPVVAYQDIRAAHDFLVDVLGFSSGGVVEDGDGNVIHGEVRADEDYGQREYGVTDPEGHLWGFATPYAPPAAR